MRLIWRSATVLIGWATMLIGSATLYALFVRPRLLRWGATEAETRRSLPGDNLVADPQYATTHGVTIRAPARAIWPWLVQLGQGRGGFYSYDWLENLFQLDLHSADRIVPDLQALQVGDTISLAPNNGMPMAVVTLAPPQALVLRTGDPDAPLAAGDYRRGEIAGTWAFCLDPIDDRTARLIVRWRSGWQPSRLASLLNTLLLEPAHFIMERKTLLGIKQRAEASPAGTG